MEFIYFYCPTFVEKSSPSSFFCTFVKNMWDVLVLVYLGVHYSVSLIYISVSMMIPYSLD